MYGFEYLVSVAVLGSNVANFPAIYKILRTKRAQDLSIITSYMWLFITLILTIYAINIGDIYFILSNAGMFIVNLIMTILIIKYG
jgi:uncharacterized protein with PQ loop repeat